MIARIEQVTTTEAGQLALYVSYWDGATRVNAEQLVIGVPEQLPTAEIIEEWRNPLTGLRETVLDVPLPDSPTRAEWEIAVKIGLKEKRTPYTAGQWFADFAVAQIKSFADLHRTNSAVVGFADQLNDAGVLRIAREKQRFWAQRRDNAAANGDLSLSAACEQTVALCTAALADIGLARRTLGEMTKLERATLVPDPWFPPCDVDPHGLLLLPEVAGLLNAQVEC